MEKKTLAFIVSFKNIIKCFALNILRFLEDMPEDGKFIMSAFSGESVFLMIASLLRIDRVITLPTFVGSLIAIICAYRTWLSCQHRSPR